MEYDLGSVIGPGVPEGGETGKWLKKNSETNFDTAWADLPVSTEILAGIVMLASAISTDTDKAVTPALLKSVSDPLTAHAADLITDADGAHGFRQYSGTWTLVLYGLTTAGSPTYVSRHGYFTIQGNKCHIQGDVLISNKGGMVGPVAISGLPKVPLHQYNGVGVFDGHNPGADTTIIPRIDPSNYITLVKQSNTTAAVIYATEITDAFQIFNFDIEYEF